MERVFYFWYKRHDGGSSWNVGNYITLKMEPTSKIVPIGALYPLVTAMLSVLILKEGVTIQRVIGTTLIVIGIWLVK